jgi:hypothetical protein
MLMVIFGAGASFDSSPTYPLGAVPPDATSEGHNAYHRPPLARELFANRPLFIDALDLFPQCKAIVPMLRDPAVISGEKSIEALLQDIEEEAKTYPRGPQELAAVHCYLQRAISECQIGWRGVTKGVTNYLTLLREIERMHKGEEPVCLVTFNYDTLLEDALGALGHGIDRMEAYIDAPTLFRVFKLHGSVNWAQTVGNKVPVNVNPQAWLSVLTYLIEHAAELRISDTFVMCDPRTMGVANGLPAFPAIAIPVEKKNQFACPQSFIDGLTEVLPKISKILVVGWRATENHFLELLKRNLPPRVQLYIVAGQPQLGEVARVSICRALSNKLPQISTIDPGGFTDFVGGGRAKSFLEGGPERWWRG